MTVLAIFWSNHSLTVTTDQSPALFLFALFLIPKEVLQLIYEFLDVFELPVDGGESNIGHSIQTVEFLHHPLPNLSALDFPLSSLLEMEFDAIDNLFDHVNTDWPLFAGLFQAVEDFKAVERFSPAVPLHDQRKGILRPLAGGKSFMAAEAFPSPSNGVFVFSQPGIDHLTFEMTAKRALHLIRLWKVES